METTPLTETFVPGCTYCEGFLMPGAPHRESRWNRRVLEAEHFVVVPTLGMLVPGWLLIVSKSHCPNLASVSEAMEEELERVHDDARSLLEQAFGRPIFFEHGPAPSSRSAGGSCIDHAHWHAVPASFDLLPDLARDYDVHRIDGFSELRRIHREHGAYLFYEDQEGRRFACASSSVPSQYFRRLVAKQIGTPELWDWAVIRGEANLEATFQRLSSLRRVETAFAANGHNLSSRRRGDL
jgi:diadenosine tetraphosphate (Ap4A) HIT family hydrolase